MRRGVLAEARPVRQVDVAEAAAGEWADAPTILKQAAAHWPACQGAWTPEELAKRDVVATVRQTTQHGANGRFPYVEPVLRWVYRSKAPVRTTRMRLERCVSDLPSRSLYVQTAVRHTCLVSDVGAPAKLRRDETDALWQRLRDASTHWVEAQPPRLWLSCGGAISPTHFDTSHSVLVQCHGRKRMLLFHPNDTPRLGQYPNTHPLRRRALLDITAEDNECVRASHPAFFVEPRPIAWEAVLDAGDVLVFPPFWMHWTESLGSASASLTRRFRRPRGWSCL